MEGETGHMKLLAPTCLTCAVVTRRHNAVRPSRCHPIQTQTILALKRFLLGRLRCLPSLGFGQLALFAAISEFGERGPRGEKSGLVILSFEGNR